MADSKEENSQYKITTGAYGYILWELTDAPMPPIPFGPRQKIWFPLAPFDTYKVAEEAATRMKNSEPVYF